MRKIMIAGIFFTLTACTYSCSSNLTRDKAKAMIIQKEGFPKEEVRIMDLKVREERMPYLKPLIDQGYITATKSVEKYRVFYYLMLTEKAQPLIRGQIEYSNISKINFAHIKYADIVFDKVTGITGDEKKKQVEYTFKYENITPFGLNASTQYKIGAIFHFDYKYPGQRTEHFVKYDDGWRLRN